jgi:molecular chaperone DnaJ
MSTKRCYYETLEVERSADDGKLKAAFRKLAMKWHPDKNPGDASSEVRFKEINEAYEVLKDGEKRAAYDRYGHAAFEQGMGGGGPGFGAGFASSFSDIFEDLFGMAGQRGRGGGRERGADLRYNMEITLEEAFQGKTAQIEIPVSVTCEPCSGTGAKAGTKPKTCSTCGGAGRCRSTFRRASRTAPAFVWPAKARPASAAGRPAISIFSCRSRPTNSSSATAPICIAGFRSRWLPPPSAANSRSRPSTRARPR